MPQNIFLEGVENPFSTWAKLDLVMRKERTKLISNDFMGRDLFIKWFGDMTIAFFKTSPLLGLRVRFTPMQLSAQNTHSIGSP
jgi:hypothetical protein